MIGDSNPWKEDLLRVADRLEQRSIQRRWTARTDYLVERDLMVGAYAVRRLAESNRLSDDLMKVRIEVTRFKATGRRVNTLSRHQIDQNYSLDRGTREQRLATSLCNSIIHSFVWVLSVDDSVIGFDGVYVSSDFDRSDLVLRVPLAGILGLFRRVGHEEIVGTHFRTDPDGKSVVRNFTAETIDQMPSSEGAISIERLK